MILGIMIGLGAATCQSLSYVGSAIFNARFKNATIFLLSLAHIIMGILALAIMPFVLPKAMPAFSNYAINLFVCSVFYLAGQASLFMALKTSQASRISPLLGLKIFMLALISTFLFGKGLTLLQWVSVIISISAAFTLSWTGQKMTVKSLLWVLLACLCYCISDLNVKSLASHFEYLGLLHGSVLSACLSYIICGLIGTAMLIMLPKPLPGMWVTSVPFALAWLSAMFFLFACFTTIGVVYGNIVQSTRGIISIGFAAILVSNGFEHLDQKVSRDIFYKRLVAAVMMTAAIALYYFGVK